MGIQAAAAVTRKANLRPGVNALQYSDRQVRPATLVLLWVASTPGLTPNSYLKPFQDYPVVALTLSYKS